MKFKHNKKHEEIVIIVIPSGVRRPMSFDSDFVCNVVGVTRYDRRGRARCQKDSSSGNHVLQLTVFITPARSTAERVIGARLAATQ